jgi:hypothetical protein
MLTIRRNRRILLSTATKQGVIGALRATGSTDQVVLFAAKEDLLDGYRSARTLSWIPLIAGALLTVTLVGAVLGIPLLLLAWWLRRTGQRNLATVEAGYAEYLSSLGLKPLLSLA